jgi:hypothetical protein
MKTPKTQNEILMEVRSKLAENFDCGIAIVSWEEQGTTYHMEVKFGNEYAVKSIIDSAQEIFEEGELETIEEEEA